MTPEPATAVRSRVLPGTASRLLLLAPALVLALVAFAVRAVGLSRANELFIDELTYVRLAQSVSDGELPNLSGPLFFLHPPGSFLLNGTVITVLGLDAEKISLVYDLRWVNAVLGGVVVALAFLVARRLTTTPIALVAAAVLTFEPFVLRNDSRVMIETPTMVLFLAGLLVIVTALDRSPAMSTRAAAGAGLLFGLAVLTKDFAAFLTFLPVTLATLWRGSLRRRDATLILGTATLPYLIYLAVLAVDGHAPAWLRSKTSGINRLLGVEQTSGFNAPGAPGLVERLIDELTRFGTSYVLIGACAAAGGLVVVLGRTPGRRILGLTGLTIGVLGLYAAFFGTLEEQYGYYVTVLSVLTLAVAGVEVIERRPRAEKLLVFPVAVFLAVTVVLGVQARLVSDDGYLHAREWIDGNLPADVRIGLTSPTAEFAFVPLQQKYGVWPSLRSLHRNNAEYVLTQSRPLLEGYGYAAPQLLGWLDRNAVDVYSFTGPSGGRTQVWQLDRAQVAAALAAGTDFRPVTGNHR